MVSLLILIGCGSSSNSSENTHNDKEVYIENEGGERVASMSDFAEASITTKGGGQIAVVIEFEDANYVKEITEVSVGETMPIYLDNELISSPKVTMPIESSSIMVQGDLSEEKAQEIVDVINQK